MIKGFTFDGVPGSLIREIWNDKRVYLSLLSFQISLIRLPGTPSKVNPFIIPDFSYKTAPPKVNPFIILDLSYKTTPPKVNPFIIPDLSYKTTPSKVNPFMRDLE
jgi:hypothetical protein